MSTGAADAYWIWKSLRASDDEARIGGRPDSIAALGVRFDEGTRVERPVPHIRLVRDDASQGRLTDNQLAPGTTGLVFSTRLRALLAAAGVSNIDYYPVTIEDPITGTQSDDHQLANVIGRVDCIDLARSDVQRDPRLGGIEAIDALALDVTRLGPLRMVRAAEHAQVIVVHEAVRNACVAAGITGVAFFRPEEFSL